MTIGNFADAMLAKAGGGKYLGEGSDRVAYLVNGVVYKVALHLDDYYMRREFENLTTVTPTVPWVKLPAISQYEVGGRLINAMEFISGTANFEWTDTLTSALFDINMQDHCVGNVLLDDNGAFWVIDFGE